MKAPNSNFQAPEKHQASSTKLVSRVSGLDVNIWNFSGAWMLVLGGFSE
jgi:hypothetical protein